MGYKVNIKSGYNIQQVVLGGLNDSKPARQYTEGLILARKGKSNFWQNNRRNQMKIEITR